MPLDLSPLWISLKTATLATFIAFFLGLAAAYWMLGYQGKAKALIEGLLLLPLVLPPTVAGFLLLLLLGKNSLLGQVLLSFNITIVFTWYAAVVTATVVAFPLMYKTALGAFEQIDVSLLQVARTLGASEWKIFWRITLPLALPGVSAGVILAFARALGEFGATLMLAGNIPGQTETIPMAIYFAVEGGAMQEAWFWTAAIISLSVSGLVIVNSWKGQSPLDAQRRSMQQVIGAETVQLRIQDFGFQQQEANEDAELVIAIQKHLPDFCLDVRFKTQQQPLGILGASGAGKSMLLRCIAGIETPTQGKILLNGRILFDSETGVNMPSRDRRLGLLVQNYALFPHLTVAQNIAFGLPKRYSPHAIRQEVASQLSAVQLSNLENYYPHQLSGGQQQRVALARALASQPDALLLDEPFSALDTYLRSQLEQAMIARLAAYRGPTLFVTHNLEEAYRVCEDLLVLDRGKAIAQGSKQSIFEQPASFRVAQLTGCKNFSRVIAQTTHQVEAVDWGCTLKTDLPVSQQIAHIGIRAHQISFTNNPQGTNTFPCWLVATSETPHRMTLYLRLHQHPNETNSYHLQAEVFKERWAVLQHRPFPWYVCLDPLRLILMTESS
jgi:molybdate ABC transporter permease protein